MGDDLRAAERMPLRSLGWVTAAAVTDLSLDAKFPVFNALPTSLLGGLRLQGVVSTEEAAAGLWSGSCLMTRPRAIAC